MLFKVKSPHPRVKTRERGRGKSESHAIPPLPKQRAILDQGGFPDFELALPFCEKTCLESNVRNLKARVTPKPKQIINKQSIHKQLYFQTIIKWRMFGMFVRFIKT